MAGTRLIPALLAFVACASGAATPVEAPPGAAPYPAELAAELGRALAARGGGYVPRTRHLRADGTPKYTNRLIRESSPYLQQHAHNPVDWFPWGDDAFETAERLGRPVLLSIGYSTCHWCHVMEEESFEDEEIAAYLNANYVAIKVDREERPDIDAIYMQAVYAVTGRGGWPMTTWLTADRKPFFGGTYFPARDGDRGARKGFLSVLRELKAVHAADPERVAAEAEKVHRRIEAGLRTSGGGASPDAKLVEAAATRYTASFDDRFGGLRSAPKFPSTLPIRLLLRQYANSGDARLLEMSTLTLERMAQGGLHDQIGGGFHRYSVDARWLVPHFEKMLYDNALLTMAYLDGYVATGRRDFAEVARATLDYVAREMTAPTGAFYSATDADSLTPTGEREEGVFFTWTPDELGEILGADLAASVIDYYGVTAAGNFEGRNILHVADPDSATDETRARVARAREPLYEARARRPPPLLDDKILTSWNGLMISAFAVGGFVLDEPDYVERAAKAARFLLKRSRVDGRLRRSFKDGAARHNAYLEDYAFLIAGLIHLFEADGDPAWLDEALSLQGTLDELHGDVERGGYYRTSHDHEALLARERPSSDGAVPSGNSVAAMNLARLHALTSDDRYRVSLARLFDAFASKIGRSSEMLLALDFGGGPPKEIVLVAPGARRGARDFEEVLRSTWAPNRVLIVVPGGRPSKRLAERVPLVAGKVARDGKTTAYVCVGGVCALPTTDPKVFASQLVAAAGPSADAASESRENAGP